MNQSSNTYATFEAQFMIILSNTEAELKKSVACTKKSMQPANDAQYCWSFIYV